MNHGLERWRLHLESWPHDPIIAQHLVDAGAPSEPRPPRITTSGTSLAPIYINTALACGDPRVMEFLDANRDDGAAIARYALERMAAHPSFREEIEILASKVEALFQEDARERLCAVSGGMRRDLIFSVPIAALLGVPHITIAKQSGGWPLEEPQSARHAKGAYQPGLYVVHVADILNKGSSPYSLDETTGRSVGWIPFIRGCGALVEHIVTPVDLRRGAAERLVRFGLRTHAAVAIDREFLARCATDPETASAYLRDEHGWTEQYLSKHGVGVLITYFAPDNPQRGRGAKFLRHYASFLQESGLYAKLEDAVRDVYGEALPSE